MLSSGRVRSFARSFSAALLNQRLAPPPRVLYDFYGGHQGLNSDARLISSKAFLRTSQDALKKAILAFKGQNLATLLLGYGILRDLHGHGKTLGLRRRPKEP